MTAPAAGRACLLFDLDGTMLDTDHLHLRAWNEVLHGPALDEAFYRTRIMGLPNAQITRLLLPDGGEADRQALADAKETRFRSLLGGSATPLPGLALLLDAAEAAGIGLAVVTNAPRANAEAMLRGLGWASRFPVLVIGEELPRPKPDPLPYIVALEQLGGSAAAAIAFEDSRSGMRAAAGCGAFTVGIATTLGADELRAAGAALVVRDYTDPLLGNELRARAGIDPGATGRVVHA
ncbi:HAD family hydrolase [Falsiroseomonas oryziterrae]|uniref:HAD family hydrolase n=1 Tax=Falsiroseomonas oryziterrae TaxID=2911368 RepID=UPI001F014DAE|nr:HAD-IA family hydrolase [Roseomonas sp. NPKOSM-4]